ncbi:Retrovirus-related Pol polyprotein from transposon RE1 [Vitis vinifera]|uniref:Retrovirus-related Pol polyprotein from transposon RE1 n=1 Tax=Vitis vinifera TaxID=29760 RepID=A0A438BUF2_VITVI|nr:Retrovirus-related Pol polyprotein from transposon RE1 [Vitis vinifera]
MTPSNISSVIPVFNGEHYHIWAVKMRFYLRSQGLWNVVMSEADPPPLGANPTVAQMKAYEEEKLKKDKAITCLHSGLANHIFTKIMNLETPKQVWDKLQGEFEGNERVKNVRLLTLKREFELMKMKDDESVKDYSGRLMDVVNQMRLLGEAFTDQKVVEKIMVSVPQKFEAKISAIEESCDLQTLTIVELTSKLHAQEQRVLMRGDEAIEGAFQANHKGKNSGNLQGKKFFKNSRGKAEGSSRKGKFPPCSHCKRTNHAEKDCWHKGKPLFNCNFCNKLGHSEKYCRAKKKQSQQQPEQHASVTEEEKNDDEHLFMASQALSSHELNTWLIDSGCTSHMTKHLSIFTSIDRSVQPKVKLGNGEVVQAKGKGTIAISTKRGTKIVTNVLYIPDLDQNLLSVAQMLRNGYAVSFKENFCFISDVHGTKIAKIKMNGNSFYLKLDLVEGHVFSAKIDESVVWHKRYGHFNLKSLRFMQEAGMVEDMPEISVNAQTCESCELGKQQRQPFPQNMSKRATHKLELIHSDICGPMSTTSLSNNVYFALFIDDFSRMTWVYFLKTKSQVLSMFKSFKKMVETQSGQNVKVLRTDNGGEYTSKEFSVFCQEAGIVHQLTAPYSPQQNGVSERKNRTVMEMARCMLFEKKLPKLLWAEAVNTSVYLLNRLPTKSVQSKTPIEAWSGVKPSIKHLKVFGSFCYLHVPSVKRGSLMKELRKVSLLVMQQNQKKVHKCDQTTPSILEPAIESTIIEGPLDVEATSDTPVLKMRPLSDVYERCNLVHAEPTCYTEAARFLEWIEAMKAEIDAIERNGTWKLTELPEAKNAIGVKWVFRTKFNSDGSIFRHKARLVVKGFAQVAGVDYGDTFAPVARHDTIRLLLALAGQMGWKVYHLDVKSAFLNGILLEDIYVQQPEGFEVIGHEHKVYKLHKALYGLKQAPRAWYSRIDSHLIQLGFRRSENEATLYLKQNDDGLQLDVFEMSDLGIMNYFLGMEIYQCSWGIFISQRKYAMDILKKFKLESCKEVATPLAQNDKISKNDGEKLEEPFAYRSLVGSLLYLTVTKPDLMFPASLLSRFMSSPSNVHMGVAKRVLKYVKGTTNLGIWYLKTGGVKLDGYADSDWAGSVDDMKSTSGYAFTIGSGVICWNSRKQEVVAQSTTEAEYISLAAAANQAIWLRKLLVDLGQEQSSPTKLYCDNKSAISIAQNPVHHGRTKHINVKFHSIREAEKNSLVKLHYCSTDEQLADIMTKGLPKSRLEFLRLKLGMSKANLKEEC